MSREELQLFESVAKITSLAGHLLRNCEYCEDCSIDVSEVRKKAKWLIDGAARDLEILNARILREYDLCLAKD